MKLEWVEGRSRGHAGMAGKVRLFSVSWGLVRTAHEPWELHCDLPGYTNKSWACADLDEAHAKAERILAAWLKATGLGGE